jgi:hypothetical protein
MTKTNEPKPMDIDFLPGMVKNEEIYYALRAEGTNHLFFEEIDGDVIKRDKIVYAELFDDEEQLFEFIKDNNISLDGYEIVPVKITYESWD